MTRSDPIGKKYYRPLSRAEHVSTFLFWVSAILSIITLILTEQPWSEFLQMAFVTFVVALFVLGYFIRLWLAPRAEKHRRLDLLSNSYSVSLTHENATEYFNNNEKNPIRRLTLSILESSFFTKSILMEMLRWERTKIVFYFIFWLICVLTRRAELSWVAVATQAIFSEELVAKWLRMEWLRLKCEEVFNKLQRLVITANGFSNSNYHAQVLENFSEYEAAKARASTAVSESIFKKRNPALSAEWDAIRVSMKLK